MKFLRNQRGDTIIEVLISIAALSMVMSVAYGLATKSSQTVRQSQERGEALKLTQSQLERLKQYFSVPEALNTVPDNSVFCMKYNTLTNKIEAELFTSPLPPVNAQDEVAQNFVAFAAHPDCKPDPSGNYYTYVVRDGNTFTAHTRWFNATGRGVDESTMVYSFYPDNFALSSTDLVVGVVGCPANQYKVSNGNCEPCPAGYTSPGGFLGIESCSPVPPTIYVVVQKVNPSGETTPPCGAPYGVSDRSGAVVTLTSASPPTTATATTGAGSRATFSNLLFSTNYQATFAAPGGTNPATRYWAGGEPSFSACAPTLSNTNTPAKPLVAAGPATPSQQTASPTFRFVPNCYVAEGNPYDHYGPWYTAYTAPYDHYGPWVYWQQPWGTSFNGYSAGRYHVPLPALADGSFYWNGPRYDLGYSVANGWYYELWRNMVARDYYGYYGDPYSTRDYYGNYGDPVNRCPV